MIKIQYDSAKECIEFAKEVIDATNKHVVVFGEVESLDSCTEEEAKRALDILNKQKQENENREECKYTCEKECKNISEFKEWIEEVNERMELFSSIDFCEKCGRIVANSEELTSFPVLTSYDRKRSVFEQLETVAICPNCLMDMTRIYESPF
ncbi:hypothetical protein [Clostridioides difficile]|uniref:hypothetical protein n=1 Tax=Clostridioides difficile TaxID=1496 RepID=UPI0003B2AB43|nr:hypothetical protein [Clostridioides difficile]EGT3674381.1 hypothetical protein [Clostridioides difficile]EGT4377856.1 hypothetical protein [Clostridioides difficile]EGT5403865.1 hypothetical protein [Clostridioides difficile]EGT5546377.1 hypothetical protein [Clostridioides difficile]EJA6791040.1 hypothetical protein [Clostridioides difficile]